MIDFPASPSVNDQYTDSDRTWRWNGSGWQLVTSSLPLGSVSSPSLYFGSDTNTGLWSPAADTLAVSTGGAEALRITSDKYLRMAASTGGIQFNGDTAAANALDDYEEGTFVPGVIGADTAGTVTYGFQLGRYTKIGRVVFFDINIGWEDGASGVGQLVITGFPFLSKNDSIFSSIPLSITTLLDAEALGILPDTVEAGIFYTSAGSIVETPWVADGELYVTGMYVVEI
jgi:hypothetical protein